MLGIAAQPHRARDAGHALIRRAADEQPIGAVDRADGVQVAGERRGRVPQGEQVTERERGVVLDGAEGEERVEVDVGRGSDRGRVGRRHGRELMRRQKVELDGHAETLGVVRVAVLQPEGAHVGRRVEPGAAAEDVVEDALAVQKTCARGLVSKNPAQE